MIRGIAHIALKVRDMDASLAFYCGGMGLTKAFEIADDDGKPWIVYVKLAPGSFIELFYGGGERDAQTEETAGFMHLCIECDDVCATVDELRARGVAIDVEPNRGKDNNTQAWVHDPDGNKIELMTIDPSSPQANA